jgi:hypothetical protein
MKRLPGCLLFLAAAIYLAVEMKIDVITLLAVLGAVLGAVLALSGQHLWAMVLGVGLVSVSLTMQITMNYWCETCLKGDTLILGAVVCLALIQKGRVKTPARVMAGVLSAVMICVALLVTPVQTGAASISEEGLSREIVVMAQEKPVLLFNPNCSPCGEVIEELIKVDPAGVGWFPVQSGGKWPDGLSYLTEKGYSGGEPVFIKQPSGVPALVLVQDGAPVFVRGKDKILDRVRG